MSEVELTPTVLARHPLPEPVAGGDKNSRGRLLVFGGDEELPGATVLCANAALRVGAGKLQIAALAAHATALGVAIPEARVIRAPAAPGGGSTSGRPKPSPDLSARSTR